MMSPRQVFNLNFLFFSESNLVLINITTQGSAGNFGVCDLTQRCVTNCSESEIWSVLFVIFFK